MARLIDADALNADFIQRYTANADVYLLVRKILNDAPSVDAVEVVRCKDCVHAEELDKHCEFNRNRYRHCRIWRGEEEKNVWHKYKKYYRDYSLVKVDGFCDEGERKVNE